MKKIAHCSTALLFVTLLPLAGYCQEFKIRNYQNFEVGFHVTSLFEPGYQRGKLTVGYQFTPKFQLFIGGAYGLGAVSPLSFNAKKIDQKFHELIIGAKYIYRDDSRSKRSSYFEFQSSFIQEHFFRSNDWYYSNGQYLQYAAALASKKSWRAGFYFGKQRHLNRKLSLNWYWGLNVRINSLQHHAFETVAIEKPLMGEIMKKFDRIEGVSIGVTPVIGISLNWRPFDQVVKIK